ncbi:MAG: cadherin domain-containing protein [Cyclobacteriaceae bacterium]
MNTILKICKIIPVILLVYIVSCSEDETATAPQIDNQTFSIEEGSPNETLVGIVIASSSQNITFSITEGNIDNAFTIDASSGELSVANSNALIFDINPSFALTVQANVSDAFSTATITINLTESASNNTPIISDQSFSVEENTDEGIEIGTVMATDSENDALSFSITSGNTRDAFTLSETGVLSVATASQLDFETTPTFNLTVEVSDGNSSASANVTITVLDVVTEPLISKEEIDMALDESYTRLQSLIQHAYIFDAIYSNTDAALNSDWEDVYNHSVITTNAQVEKLWVLSYDIIYGLNNIISSAENIELEAQHKTDVINQAIGMRGYIYFNLARWFENAPIELGISPNETPFSQKEALLNQASMDLTAAASNLPASASSGENGITSDFVKFVSARLAAATEDWNEALTKTSDIINSGSYSLKVDVSSFSSTDAEVIWGSEKDDDTPFASFFDKGTYVPAARYTEVLLLNAEASAMIGNSQDALTQLNAIRLRSGQQEFSGLSFSQLLEAILAQLEAEITQEGEVFASLRRFGVAQSRFDIPETRLILPIPQSIIDSNPNAFQNPGY